MAWRPHLFPICQKANLAKLAAVKMEPIAGRHAAIPNP
jgi:hypothetical protein